MNYGLPRDRPSAGGWHVCQTTGDGRKKGSGTFVPVGTVEYGK